MRAFTIGGLAALLVAGGASLASAQGSVNVYCSVQVEWCQAAAVAYERSTGTKVNMTQKGSGETLAQVRAEAQNPKGDIWFGGTGDPHLIMAEEGLSEVYESPRASELQNWALRQHEASGRRSVGVYSGAVGFGFNRELMARKKLAEAACWADLLKPEYKGEIQVAKPSS